MWYANPFIMLPATWLILGGIAFVSTWQSARKGHKKMGIFFAVLFASFTTAGVAAIVLGWVLRHQDQMEQVFNIISN